MLPIPNLIVKGMRHAKDKGDGSKVTTMPFVDH